MADDVLRLRATVVSDEALKNLRALQREIGMVGTRGAPAIKQVNTEFGRLASTIRNVGQEMTAIVPSLGRFGLGAGGVALAAGTLIRSFSDISKKIVELGYASKELGMSERELRGWSNAAEKAGISTETMLGGLERFKANTDGLKYNIGGLRDELISMGAGGVVRGIMSASTQAEKLRIALGFRDTLLKSDPSGFKAKHWMDQWGLGFLGLRVTAEEAEKAINKVQPFTPQQMATAKQFNDALITLNQTWTDLYTKAAIGLFPGLTKDFETAEKLLNKIRELKEWRDKNMAGDPSKERRFIDNDFFSFGFNPDAPFPKFFTPGPGTPQSRAGGSYRKMSLGGGGGEMDEFTTAIKNGVFAGMVEFAGYMNGGGTGGGGGGFTNASFNPGAGGAGTGGFRSGGGFTVMPQGSAPNGSSVAPASGSNGTQVAPPGANGQYRPQYTLGDADTSDAVVNTIAGEARGSQESTDAVIHNMFNRLGTKMYGPSGNLQEVARAPGQYAGYSRADAKRAEFIRSRIRAIASGSVPDPTGGANEFRTTGYNGPWSRNAGRNGIPIGGNTFAYNPAAGKGPYAPYGPQGAPSGATVTAGAGDNGEGPTLYPRTADGKLHPTEAGMQPELRARLLKMKADSPYGGASLMGPRSGHRSYQDQVDIYKTARPGYAAIPGRSQHGRGAAADLKYGSAAERNWYHQNAAKYGIKYPMGHEPWHAQADPSYRGPNFIDQNIAGGNGGNVQGSVNVNVTSNGTAARVDAKSTGFWQETSINNYRQMTPTENPTTGFN